MVCLKVIIMITLLSFWTDNFSIAQSSEDSSRDDVIERFDNIRKPPKDRRSYRGLILKNEMKVLLIHDPLPDKSAVAMVVGAGSINDFRDLPGISSLVVLLLLVASKKHSEIWCEFDKIVRLRDGYLEYMSTLDTQIFHFNINPDHLVNILDRFSEYFIEPLLNSNLPLSFVDSAINIMEKQYQDNMKNDTIRIAQVEMLASKKNHAYNHLHGGNQELMLSMNPTNVPEKLLYEKYESLLENARQFFSNWYSSSIMSLVVSGKESLDELENRVVSSFKNVQNKNREKFLYRFEYHPWGSEQVKNKIYVVPLSDESQNLRVSFPIPDIRNSSRSSAQLYIHNMMSHKGLGGLYSVLKKRDLCKELHVESDGAAGFGFYIIYCKITDDGVERVDEILTLIFQYIRLLNEIGAQKRIFEEFAHLQKIFFDNYSPEDIYETLAYVTTLASELQSYTIESILSHAFITENWDLSVTGIRDILCHLKPENMNVTIISKADSVAKIANMKEPYFGAKYRIVKIPDKLIEEWKTVELNPEFHIPPVNNSIPRNFDLYPIALNEPEHPYLIHSSTTSNIWFKQNSTIPKLNLTLEISSKFPYFSPLHRSLWHFIFSEECSFESLKEYFYFDNLAGFELEVRFDDYGLLISLEGFSDTFLIVLEKLLSKLMSVLTEINSEERFNVLRNKYILHFSTITARDPFFQGLWFADHSLSNGTYMMQDNLNAAKKLQFDDAKKFLKNAFKRIHIRGFIHGNCSKQKADDIVHVIRKPFLSSHGLLLQEILRPRIAEIAEGSNVIFHASSGRISSYSYSTFYQFHTEYIDTHNPASLLIEMIFMEYCTEMLPHMTENPSTDISCQLIDMAGFRGYFISLQTKRDPRSTDSKMEIFLKETLPGIMKNLSDDQIEKMKKIIIEDISSSPKPLKDLSQRYWYEIKYGFYNFERPKMEIQQLKLLRKADLIAFFNKMFNPSASTFRKLTVYEFPKNIKRSKMDYIPKGGTKFEDIVSFQHGLNLLPRVPKI